MIYPDRRRPPRAVVVPGQLARAFEPRRDEERVSEKGPAPLPGAGQPVPPPRTMRLRLPIHAPVAMWVLLVLNLAIFIVPALLDLAGMRFAGVPISEALRLLGAKNNRAILFGGEYYRFLTSMFLHGSLLHIAFNAYALYALGAEVERIYGTPRFLGVYFIAGFAGGVASYTLTPNNSVGASGAIFGLIGALATFLYIARDLLGEMARLQLGNLITVIMINLFIGFSSPIIDNVAHIGGLIGGVVVGYLLAPRFAIDARTFPPAVVRTGLPLAWGWALAIALLLALLVPVINPPILPR